MSIQIQGGPRLRMRWLGALGAALVVLLVLVGAWSGWAHRGATEVAAGPQAPAGHASDPSPRSPGQAGLGPTFQTGLENLPKSLQGSEVNGDARADAAGRLVVDRGLRELFDYFLSLLGEESLEVIRGRLQAWLSGRLPASARAQALDLLARYIAYQKARGAADPGRTAASDAALSLASFDQRQQRLAALRARHFTPDEVQAFFGEEIMHDRHVQARWTLMSDAALPPVEKARRLDALKAGMPEGWRAAESVAERHRDLTELSEDWRRRQGDPVELRQIRERLVGAEAADRLEGLDRQRADWAQRLATWRVQSARIRDDAQLSEPQRAQALNSLRQQSFNDREWLRVEAMGSLSVQ